MTKNGIGVGQGLNGELLTELRVLLNTEWGHCGGPTCPPEDELPLLEERPFRQGIFDQPLTFFPDNPANKYLFDWYVDSNFYISMKGYLIKVSSYISVKYIVILFKISSCNWIKLESFIMYFRFWNSGNKIFLIPGDWLQWIYLRYTCLYRRIVRYNFWKKCFNLNLGICET